MSFRPYDRYYVTIHTNINQLAALPLQVHGKKWLPSANDSLTMKDEKLGASPAKHVGGGAKQEIKLSWPANVHKQCHDLHTSNAMICTQAMPWSAHWLWQSSWEWYPWHCFCWISVIVHFFFRKVKLFHIATLGALFVVQYVLWHALSYKHIHGWHITSLNTYRQPFLVKLWNSNDSFCLFCSISSNVRCVWFVHHSVSLCCWKWIVTGSWTYTCRHR